MRLVWKADRHALVSAPTGSGKTLVAFLWALDRLAGPPQVDCSYDPQNFLRLVTLRDA